MTYISNKKQINYMEVLVNNVHTIWQEITT